MQLLQNVSKVKIFILTLGVVFAIFVSVIIINTFGKKSKQFKVQSISTLEINLSEASKRLSGAVKIKTISTDGELISKDSFLEFHRYIEKQFPLVHKTIKKEIINQLSLLYTWQGSDSKAPAILIMAHQDVVPVAPNTENKWTHAPYSGDIADGFIWGRGAWDDKGNLLSILEATELLIQNGYRPKNTIYLAFGHDEESGLSAGLEGARKIVETLRERQIRLALVLDEGLLIMHNSIKGVDAPIALVGVAEKGYVTLKLSAEATPGHSSMPTKNTAIGSLSTAISKVESNPFPSKITEPVQEMFETLAPESKGINKIALSNLWLFSPYIKEQISKTSGGASMVRTTIAPTIFQSGSKENVLPGIAEATINYRTLPGTSSEDVIKHTKNSIQNPLIKIRTSGYVRESSMITKTKSKSYLLIQQSIHKVFPDVVVAPGLMTAATDSHHYLSISDAVFRFSPVRATTDDLQRFHGTNERLSIKNYKEMIQFYYHLMSSPSLNSLGN